MPSVASRTEDAAATTRNAPIPVDRKFSRPLAGSSLRIEGGQRDIYSVQVGFDFQTIRASAVGPEDRRSILALTCGRSTYKTFIPFCLDVASLPRLGGGAGPLRCDDSLSQNRTSRTCWDSLRCVPLMRGSSRKSNPLRQLGRCARLVPGNRMLPDNTVGALPRSLEWAFPKERRRRSPVGVPIEKRKQPIQPSRR
jgi:hypothetical protein